jgi:hypothetical protein
VGGDQLVGLTLRAFHLGAIGVWVGGLIVLITCMPSGSRGVVLRRFSPIAAGAVVVAVVSGLGMSSREVHSLTAAFRTGFGQTLAVKVSLLAVALLIAVSHRRRLRRGSVPHPRVVACEAVMLAVIVIGGAMLSVKPPAVGARFEPGPVEQTTSKSLQIDDVLVQVSIRPNRPGRNTVSVSVLNTRRPAPAVIDETIIRLTSPTQAPIERTMPGAFGPTVDVGAVDLVAPGELGVEVSVNRPKLPLATYVIPWSVNALPLDRPATVISDAPLDGVLRAAAVAVGLGGLAWALVVQLRRKRSNGDDRSDRSDRSDRARGEPAGSVEPDRVMISVE